MSDWVLLLVFAAPVLLAALGEAVTQRSGVLNIGVEGIMLGAAFGAAMTTLQSGSPWLGLLAGIVIGLFGSVLVYLFCVRMTVDQVVVGTALNLLSLGLTSSLYRASFGQTGAAISLPGLPQWQGLDPIASFTLLAVPLAAAVMFRTNWGLAVRAVGELPRAAEASGFRVARLRGQALLVGGFFAGLAGAYLAVGITGSFNENMTAGRGFLAIALVTFGRWNPWLILFASLLVGYVTSLQFTMQASGITLPKELLIALPYLAALAVLVLVGRGVDAPAALARPYRKEG